MNSMKYCLVVAKESDVFRENDFTLTGLLQWLRIFDGDQLSLSQLDEVNLDFYDVIHVNMCTRHAHLPKLIREKIGERTDVKLICNLDYAFELIPHCFRDPKFSFGHALESMSMCDLVFAQEPLQAQFLRHCLNRGSNSSKFEVPLIEHPADIELIRKHRCLSYEREDKIVTLFHKEDPQTMFASFVLDSIKIVPWKTQLLGYLPYFPGEKYGYFDDVVGATEFEIYLDLLATAKLAYEHYTIHSHGRFTIDCAALGVPVFGSNYVSSVNRLYPDSAVDVFSIKQTKEIFDSIISDNQFRESIVKIAFDNVEYYSHKNKKKQLLEALENG